MSSQDSKKIMLLLHGIDTLQCAYYCLPVRPNGIDFRRLNEQKEDIRQTKRKNPLPVIFGNTEFFLQPYGTASGYPLVIENGDFKIEMGEFNNPNFFVTFRSQALWQESAFSLHEKFLQWISSVGYRPYHRESLSRVDFSFDYNLPSLDFNEDSFVSYSSKDSQHRQDGRVQTFTLGKGDIVLRVYDKVAEIKQQSNKVWFYLLWEQEENVWRIEWQVRKAILRQFGISTFNDLKYKQGDLLHYLAVEHDTLRVPNDDSNPSRWLLHPLWIDLQERIAELDHLGTSRIDGQQAVMEERLQRMAISIYGYLKRIAAIECIQGNHSMIDVDEVLKDLGTYIHYVHEPLTWKIDVERKIKEIQLGVW
jgi:hypothetical protein